MADTVRLTLAPAHGVTDFRVDTDGSATITDALTTGGRAMNVRFPRPLALILVPTKLDDGSDIVVDAIDAGDHWEAVAFL